MNKLNLSHYKLLTGHKKIPFKALKVLLFRYLNVFFCRSQIMCTEIVSAFSVNHLNFRKIKYIPKIM